MYSLERRKEVKELSKLVQILSNVNNGSNFMENITEAISIAKSLNTSDIDSLNQSFISFINKEATKEVQV